MECEDYIIVTGTIDFLVVKVNKALNQGYTLVGGVNYNPDNGWYMQAMCKIKKE